jgi:deazaflavin-dependent oxidoreductase (nitroreductase family)
MRKLVIVAATAAGLYGVAMWWRTHRRVGTDFMNRTVNPWLERRGLIGGSRGELGLIEHVGRKSGTVRWTAIHPMPTADGFRIIVPVGEQSQWARNVLAAGNCRLRVGDQIVQLQEPVLEVPADVPDLPRAVRALLGWLGFRYLRLRTVRSVASDAVVPEVERAAA